MSIIRSASWGVLLMASITMGASIPDGHWVVFSVASVVQMVACYVYFDHAPETAPLAKRRLRLMPGEIIDFYDNTRMILKARLMLHSYTDTYTQGTTATLVSLDRALQHQQLNIPAPPGSTPCTYLNDFTTDPNTPGESQ